MSLHGSLFGIFLVSTFLVLDALILLMNLGPPGHCMYFKEQVSLIYISVQGDEFDLMVATLYFLIICMKV